MKRSAAPTFVHVLPLIAKPGKDRVVIGRIEEKRRLCHALLKVLHRRSLPKPSKD